MAAIMGQSVAINTDRLHRATTELQSRITILKRDANAHLRRMPGTAMSDRLRKRMRARLIAH